ncbi:hypothetical protein TL16_g06212 [Triparma laevis f. inornata]|uniref:Uncharacterized protein n=1 Tax=Triparma laevis f. inornata TaxID=1714386 RepID=A0A9W7AIK5_9STRA|nr:hypothetical protein TL16_g06212 [Triparma laevis f. inornata]
MGTDATGVPFESCPVQTLAEPDEVLECATFYSVFLFAISSALPIISVHAAVTKEETGTNETFNKLSEFWWFTFGPLSFLAVGLSDEKLTKFLTEDVMVGWLLVGMAQLTFLAFGSIQCENGLSDRVTGYDECNRTLFSQTALGFTVVFLVMCKAVSGVAPKHIVDRHVVTLKSILAMNLTADEFVQAFGLTISASCAFFQLGNYGAEGDFNNEAERQSFLVVAYVSLGCLVVIAAWKLILIKREMNHEDEDGGGGGIVIEPGSTPPLTGAHKVWFYLGFVATTYFSGGSIYASFTDAVSVEFLGYFALPFAMLYYMGSFFSEPRRNDEFHMWKLRLHFISFVNASQAAWAFWNIKRGLIGAAVVHALIVPITVVIFNWCLRLRATIGNLPDEELEKFLVNQLFRGGIKTLSIILFLTFRTMKCVFEEEGIDECIPTSMCSGFISIFFLVWYLMGLIHESVKEEFKGEINLSIEKIALMTDISFRRGLQGFLSAFTSICGLFLFSMISSNDAEYDVILAAGGSGLFACVGCLLASFAVTTVYSMLYVLFAVTTEVSYMLMGNVLKPIAITIYVLSFMMKPKNEGVYYKWFLYFHFATFIVLSEGAYAIASLLTGETFDALVSIARIFFWSSAWPKALKLREASSKLPPEELSDFLCQTVLVKGTAAMGPMLFFSFEAVSCFLGQESLDNGMCENASKAALFLSIHVAFLTIISMCNNAVPKKVRSATSWEYTAVATLTLKWWQQLQGVLVTLAAISALYLLSLLGVEASPNKAVGVIGALGAIAMGFATLVTIFTISKTYQTHQKEGGGGGGVRRGPTGMLDNQTFSSRSVRSMSTGEMQENMIIGAFL